MKQYDQPYHRLIVWQRADEFARMVYRYTRSFPSEEKYGVVSQLRRASLSVPLNIVEGQARGSTKDFIRFLRMSRGSCSECAYLLEFSLSVHYLDAFAFKSLEEKRREVNFLLQKLIIGLNNKHQAPKVPLAPQIHS